MGFRGHFFGNGDSSAPRISGDGSFITSCRFIEDAVKGRTIVRYKCGPTFSNLEQYLGAGSIAVGTNDVVIAGGIESMTMVPMRDSVPGFASSR